MERLKEDAERIFKVLGARFEKYGLKIHSVKTRLLDFTKPKDGQGKGNNSFTFLGFTHYWMKSRKGKWMSIYAETMGNVESKSHGTLRILWN